MDRARVRHAPGAARISLAGTRAAYIGPGLDLAPHENAAATVAIGLAAPFRLALSAEKGRYETRTIALIPPNMRHHVVAAGPMAFVYLDAMSDDHRRLASSDLDRAHIRIAREWMLASGACNVETLCAALGVPWRDAVETRMARVIRQLDLRPQDFPRIADLAERASLSPSRFQALFRRDVGMPFRRYRLWRRMAVVMECLSKGESLTDASLEAGFASSAHLSATFRDMFGLAPSSLLKLGVHIDVAPARMPDRFAGPC